MAAGPGRDWFHCNRCYRQEGARFSVTSCGHVLCEACLGAGRGPQAFTPRRTTAGPCPICAATCRRFPIPEQLEETLFLKSPATIARQRLAHISQAWRFQQAQVDLLLASHRDAARRAEAALRDARQALDSKQRSPLPGGRAEELNYKASVCSSHPTASAAAQRASGEPLGHTGVPLGQQHPDVAGPISRLHPRSAPQGRPAGFPHTVVGSFHHPATAGRRPAR
ncbi:RING finger protein 212B isoform X20 [Numida meleagris]|uniref:RING finger protein 212B isoform X20 n=1 Tax=Numida meleagris TaxID=8996 RepID=UPI000B3E0DC7|nr:RING finger protein 212B isoform X20 [Numida meleagris]